MPTVPAGAAFQAPTGAQSAHATPVSAAPTSVVTTVKIGVRAVGTARMITIAETTSFADLLAIAIACQPADERAKMAALPVTVHCARVLVLQGRILYHDTVACLGEERGPEASHAHGSFPWCCPKCFKKGATALGKSLVQPAQPEARAGARSAAGAADIDTSHCVEGLCEGWGGLGRAGEAPGRCFDVRLRIYGFTD